MWGSVSGNSQYFSRALSLISERVGNFVQCSVLVLRNPEMLTNWCCNVANATIAGSYWEIPLSTATLETACITKKRQPSSHETLSLAALKEKFHAPKIRKNPRLHGFSWYRGQKPTTAREAASTASSRCAACCKTHLRSTLHAWSQNESFQAP